MAERVLDASAVLAFILDEPGGAAMESYFPAAMISVVNVAEAISRMIDRGASPDKEFATILRLGMEIVAVDSSLGVAAGELRRHTDRTGISLGDRICLALAKRESLPVLTADRAWAKLDIGVDVRLIR